MVDDEVEGKSKRSPNAGAGPGVAVAAVAAGMIPVGELILKAPNPLEGLNVWVAWAWVGLAAGVNFGVVVLKKPPPLIWGET